MKTLAYAAPTKWLKSLLKQCENAGYETEYDKDAGTAKVLLDGIPVLRALQHGSTWIVRGDPNVFQPF